MHDIRELDSRGIPGGFIASEAFVGAAESQRKLLGFNADAVFVRHPIQDRTDDELRALADETFPDVLKLVLGE